ncbi:hypothetical protein HPULCUR_012188 [Helicostylum pulchrum]|uniref:CCHC-type domain-containing protein n=1 Tax=Helicostylum pulchrum TaxID=562976 RepID=A0ABP9YIH0_9FUNG
MTEVKNENAINQRGPNPADYMNLMNKIPTYSGSRDVNKAEVWLKTVRSYKGFFIINFNHEMFLTAVTNSFTDRAEDWWDTVSGTVTTWEDFLNKFKSKFIQPTVGETWRKLRSIEQEQDHTVEHFTSELNVLFKAAGVKDEEMKISLFISGVKSDIGFELEKKRKNLRTYEEVVEEAANLETLLMKYNKNIGKLENKPIVTGNVMNNDASSVSTQDTLEKLINSMNQLSINIVQQQAQIKLTQQQQHITQTQQFNPRQSFNRPPYGAERRFVCWNCGKDGHASRFCPEPPANRNYQENNGNQFNDQQQGKANGQQ